MGRHLEQMYLVELIGNTVEENSTEKAGQIVITITSSNLWYALEKLVESLWSCDNGKEVFRIAHMIEKWQKLSW